MKNHTKGPWTVETRFHVHAILDPTGQEITFQDTEPREDCGSVTSRGRTAAATQATAHLIAAAPELLEALEEAITDDGAHCKHAASLAEMERRLDYITEIAREAIAKAKGGE